jgi:hypothetical protein
MLLYLDFDGVLHGDEVYRRPGRGIHVAYGRLFEHAAALEAVLEPFPTMRIVLSTTWVQVLGFSRTVARLPPGLRTRVIGATYHRRHTSDWLKQTRFNQIIADAGRRRIGSQWLAIDNDAEGWPDYQRNHLVLTDGRVGLQPHDLQLLHERLSAGGDDDGTGKRG